MKQRISDLKLLRTIIAVLPGHPSRAITPLRIAVRADITVIDVRRLLASSRRYVVNVGGAGRFCLNRFGLEKGDQGAVTAAIDAEISRLQRARWGWSALAVWFVVMATGSL